MAERSQALLSHLYRQFLKVSAPAVMAGMMAGTASAHAEAERTLSLTNLHTKESLSVIYKRGDSYVPEALARINHLLRDHRRDQEATINPATLDRLYEIGQKAGKLYPHIAIRFEIISGYRAPETNQTLRQNGGGQAAQSRHMTGDAIDMRIPGVATKTLRDIAWCTGSGGTGYYAQDGFVHIDNGPQRFWPSGWNPHKIACS